MKIILFQYFAKNNNSCVLIIKRLNNLLIVLKIKKNILIKKSKKFIKIITIF